MKYYKLTWLNFLFLDLSRLNERDSLANLRLSSSLVLVPPVPIASSQKNDNKPTVIEIRILCLSFK